jgi:hypothetical protein
MPLQAFQKFSSFEHAITLATEIAKQNEGWIEHQRQGHGQNRPAERDRAAREAAQAAPLQLRRFRGRFMLRACRTPAS